MPPETNMSGSTQAGEGGSVKETRLAAAHAAEKPERRGGERRATIDENTAASTFKAAADQIVRFNPRPGSTQ
jgi:hypothetical protein